MVGPNRCLGMVSGIGIEVRVNMSGREALWDHLWGDRWHGVWCELRYGRQWYPSSGIHPPNSALTMIRMRQNKTPSFVDSSPVPIATLCLFLVSPLQYSVNIHPPSPDCTSFPLLTTTMCNACMRWTQMEFNGHKDGHWLGLSGTTLASSDIECNDGVCQWIAWSVFVSKDN